MLKPFVDLRKLDYIISQVRDKFKWRILISGSSCWMGKHWIANFTRLMKKGKCQWIDSFVCLHLGLMFSISPYARELLINVLCFVNTFARNYLAVMCNISELLRIARVSHIQSDYNFNIGQQNILNGLFNSSNVNIYFFKLFY